LAARCQHKWVVGKDGEVGVEEIFPPNGDVAVGKKLKKEGRGGGGGEGGRRAVAPLVYAT
jgi:hypothetical protein